MSRAETPSLFPIEATTSPPSPARDEMNFAEFPMGVLTSRAPKDCLELVFTDEFTPKGGSPVTRRLTVTATPKYGLPTPKDEEVLLGLVAITKRQNNFTDRAVYFTRHELLTLLGLNNEGHSYQRLEESLHRWASVYLHYENAWWDNENKTLTDVGFHVIDQWQHTKAEGGKRGGRVVVKWNEVVLKSFRSNYVKQLDLGFYQSLESAVTKRLYRFLDKQLYQAPHRREFDLADLAYVHVGIMQSSPLFKAKQLITGATHELERRGYLEELPPSERFKKLGRGRYRILFLKKRVKALGSAEKPADVSPLASELVARGLSKPSAAKLVAKCSPESISIRLEAFDWLMQRKDRPAKPSGYLYKFISETWPLPDGFVPSTVKTAQAEAKRRELAEQARRSQQERDAVEAERKEKVARQAAVDAFLASLSEVERVEFEKRAVETAPADLAESYRKSRESFSKLLAENCRYRLLEHAIREHEGRPAA